jgi:hypothetical protein
MIKRLFSITILTSLISCAGIQAPPITELIFSPELISIAVIKTIPMDKREDAKFIACTVSQLANGMESGVVLDVKAIFGQDWDAETSNDAQAIADSLINYLSKVRVKGVGSGPEYHDKITATLNKLCEYLSITKPRGNDDSNSNIPVNN